MKFIGNLGRQDSEFDDILALNAEFVQVQTAQQSIGLVTLAACVILPGGLLVLVALLIRNHLKEKHLGSH
jgi:hypothetical protein